MRKTIYETEEALECSCFGVLQQPNKSGIKQLRDYQSERKNYVAKRGRARKQSESLDSPFNMNIRSKRSLRRQKPRSSVEQWKTINNQMIGHSHNETGEKVRYFGEIYSSYEIGKQLKSHQKPIIYATNRKQQQKSSQNRPLYNRKHNDQFLLKTQFVSENPYQINPGTYLVNKELEKQLNYYSPKRVQQHINRQNIPVKNQFQNYRHSKQSVKASNNLIAMNYQDPQGNALRFNEKTIVPQIPLQSNFQPKNEQFRIVMKQIESIADSKQLTNEFSQVICHDWTDRSREPSDRHMERLAQGWKIRKLSSFQKGKERLMESFHSHRKI